MRIVGAGDLLAADDDVAALADSASTGSSHSVYVAVAELDAYIIEVGAQDMAEVLQAR